MAAYNNTLSKLQYNNKDIITVEHGARIMQFELFWVYTGVFTKCGAFVRGVSKPPPLA